MLFVVVLREHIEVIGVEGDVEVVVVAGGDRSNGGTVGNQSAEGELVGGGDAFAGQMVRGGIILVVDVVGAADGVLVCGGHYCWVDVGVGDELVAGGKYFVYEFAVSVIEDDVCHTYVAHLVVLFAHLKEQYHWRRF